MADKVSIAIRQEKAINRINATAAQLADMVGVDAPTIRTRAHDRELLRAEQLEALAAWVERLQEMWQPADAEPEAAPAVDEAAPVTVEAVEQVETAPVAKAKTKKQRGDV